MQIYAVPEHDTATIWDADVLFWASRILAAEDRRPPTSRLVRLAPYQLLTAIGRATEKRECQLIKGALTRLQSTVIRTTIRHGAHRRRQQFSWIDDWEELATRSGRCEGMDFRCPTGSTRGVLDRKLVLAIDPYFALSGGRLCRVARKTAGQQRAGRRFEPRYLHAKSASLARCSDLALDIRRIVAGQPLPGYALALERRDDGAELIIMRSSASSGPAYKLYTVPADIGTPGAPRLGLQAHRQPSLSLDSETCPPRDPKIRIQILSCCRDADRGKLRHGAAPRRGRAS